MIAAVAWLKNLLARQRPAASALQRALELERHGLLAGARQALEELIAAEPTNRDALVRLGRLQDREGRYADAVATFERAVHAHPGDLDARHCLAVALGNAGRHKDAEAAFSAGLALQPGAMHFLVGRAAALLKLQRVPEARDCLERARTLDPRNAEVYFGLAHVALDEARVEDSVQMLREAHALAPLNPATHSGLLYAMNYSAAYPRRELFEEHRRFGMLHAAAVAPPDPDRRWPRRLRIGYLSPDFRAHVVSSFILPVIKRHDRAAFEVFCYYLFPTEDKVSVAFREIADHWRRCASMSHEDVAAWIRRDGIDVLVDLAGHTADNALGVLALRPAPVQFTYLGYPNTTGLACVDYRLTDAKADPPGEADEVHTERLVRLPRSFLCYRPGPRVEPGPLPAVASGIVTFACFNNANKLSEPFLRTAARILQAVPSSRLLLKTKGSAVPSVAARAKRHFAQAGVDAERLVFHGWEPSVEDHLAAYRKVDIALDSYPYNGTTTTCEAMNMGVPVVTVVGDRHAGRVGASLLETVGLSELVARDEDEYVAIAARLAADLPALSRLRAGMRERLAASPLRDEPGFVRHLEAAYRAAWEEKLAEPDLSRLEGSALEAKLREWRASGEAGRAIQALGAVIARQGESAQLRYQLGCAFEDAGRVSEAAASYRRALDLQPDYARAANNLGVVLQLIGDPAEAERWYGEALRLEPALVVAHANRGRLRLSQGRFAEALADLHRAAELDPGEPAWQDALRECRAGVAQGAGRPAG